MKKIFQAIFNFKLLGQKQVLFYLFFARTKMLNVYLDNPKGECLGLEIAYSTLFDLITSGQFFLFI